MPLQSAIPTLYHSRTSVCSQKVRLVLAELNLDWHSVELDLAKGEQFHPDYTELNPHATVPTYVDGKNVFTDSNDILLHLCEQHQHASLIPADPTTRQECLDWLKRSVVLHSAVHVLTTLAMNRSRLLLLPKADLELRLDKMRDLEKAGRLRDIVENGDRSISIRLAVDRIHECFFDLQSKLSQQRYLCGASVSLADFSILPFVCRLGFLNLLPGSKAEEFADIFRWRDLMMSRESYETAIRQFHSDAVLVKYHENGTKVRSRLMQGR